LYLEREPGRDLMKRLNIFVDETGEFGFDDGSSRLYGVSFTFHEQNDDISPELNILNNNLSKLGYNGMIHMADLILRRGDYTHFDIIKRKKIFNAIYQFSRRIKVKYTSIIVDKKYNKSIRLLRKALITEIRDIVNSNIDYFKRFDRIVMYYDNGQENLSVILESIFDVFDNFEHIVEFDHVEKRLFQVSDMLTFIDKYDYKYKNKISISKSEKFFFSNEEIRRVLKELNKKRF
jgi:hypothetical protein